MLKLSKYKNILTYFTVPDQNGRGYTIGPSGLQVGFKFQQNRSLTLIDALKCSAKLQKPISIAIVGGGLAGLTAKLALHGVGLQSAVLFETRDDFLKTQGNAQHRFIHPSYNDWPLAEKFDATTNFPFLNWYPERANSIILSIKEQWEVFSQNLMGLRLASHVNKVTVSKKSPTICLNVTNNTNAKAPDTKDEHFDLVIFAAGFGRELDTDKGNISSYWESDNVAKIRGTESHSDPIIVSGIGDGGIIDVVRLHFREMHDRYDLAVKLISLCRHDIYSRAKLKSDEQEELNKKSNIEEAIIILEENARASLIGNEIRSKEERKSKENEVSKILYDGYTEVVANFPAKVNKFLEGEAVVRQMERQDIKLVGSLDYPFTTATAPINKLLLAYLMYKKPKLYIKGRTRIASRTIETWETVLGPYSTKATFILRHGGKPPIYNWSRHLELRYQFIDKQFGEFNDGSPLATNFCAEMPTLASQDRTSRIYLKYLDSLVSVFAMKYFGTEFTTNLSRETKYIYFTFDELSPSFVRAHGKINGFLGGFPREIFGIPLYSEEPSRADLAMGD